MVDVSYLFVVELDSGLYRCGVIHGLLLSCLLNGVFWFMWRGYSRAGRGDRRSRRVLRRVRR